MLPHKIGKHLGLVAAILLWETALAATAAPPIFQAGAVAVDITPTNFPAIINGGFLEKTTTNVTDRLHARALALDDGSTRLVLCVVDTCMMPRDLIDRAKAAASQATGISTDRLLVSATHTHSAPASMGCLGSRADTNYVAFLPGKLVEAIQGAVKNLRPARVGWAAVEDWDHTFNRRWIRRPDKLIIDPYGQPTGRAHMHPGHQSPDAIGPSGPVDPGLSVLAVRSPEGRPIALLANYSQHYYGANAVSADYYGKFAEHITGLVGADVRRPTPNAERGTRNAESNAPAFVGIMSQGTSGDLMWMDYGAPRKQIGYDAYAREVATRAFEAYQKIQWHDWVPLKMAERKLELRYRVPDPERLAWAREKAATFEGRLPKNQPEIYALEAIHLHERQKTELKLQAIRIGDLGITAIPNEVYAITGLKLKVQSPLPATFNIELANGAEGYIPPPEQHKLGGYTTWPARTAGLEVQAEPRIVETLLGLLEKVADRERRPLVEIHGPYSEAVLEARPLAYWRLNEIAGDTAHDATGANHRATYEDGVALHLPGAGSGAGLSPHPEIMPSNFSGPHQINRAPHLAGGRITATLPNLGGAYSVSFWFWNGLPTNLRGTTGWLFARSSAAAQPSGEWLGLGGTNGSTGRLVFATSASKQPLVGKKEIGLKSWQHVTLVREKRQVRVYLNGQTEPEIGGELDAPAPGGKTPVFLGGRPDQQDNFEGRLDEVAVFDRALTATEIATHWKASGFAELRAREAAEQEREIQLAAQRAQPPVFPATYAAATLALKPSAYWHLNAADSGGLPDASPNKLAGQIEGGVTLSPATFAAFNGGRIRARLGAPVSAPAPYSVSFWFRNHLANDSRPVTAYLFSHGPNGDSQAPGDHLGIGGTYRGSLTGRLILFNGNQRNQVVAGRTIVPPNTWNHVVFIRDGRRVTAFLNGDPAPEFEGEAEVTTGGAREFFLGARSDQFAPLEGYLAEFALFPRALTGAEARQLHQASGQPVGTAKVAPPAVARALLNEVPPPLAPAAALKKIHVREEHQVELVAAEPLTLDPVAIDWDIAGRLWVVEMADYPLGMDGNGKPGGRVRVLEDTDGDGRYDKSTVFAEGLNFPNGILTWRDGVFVTAAPDILWLTDTDGVGRADVKEKVFSGFFEGNQQLRVNGLRWGLDNWVHCAAGAHRAGYGGEVRITATRTGKVVPLGSYDLRFRPDTGELDPCSGPTQFGLNRDDWGNWFGVQNSFPLWHYALDDRYLRRNPHVPPPDPVMHVIKERNPKVYPLSQVEKRYHSFNEFGRFTSACGAMIYQDTLLFGDGPNGHSFTCEPVHNIVHHEVVTGHGVSFTATRDSREQTREFFASEDLWCRPVMIRTGPDGALWVVDMYRYMIEHPQWLPPVGREEMKPHYRLGDDLGRIYRVFPRGQKPKQPVRLDKLSLPQLVDVFNSSNGWQRDKAQQLLVWRADRAAVPLLEKMARESRSPLARLHALCTLDGLNALSPDLVARALADPHPGVRVNALRLAEPRGMPPVLAAATKLVTDADPKVRLQLACTLGEWTDPQAGQALGRIAVADWQDRHITDAVMSSAVPHCQALVDAAASAGGPVLAALTKPLLITALALDQRNAVEHLLRPTLTANSTFTRQQFEAFEQFLDLLANRGFTLQKLAGNANDALAAQLRRAGDLFTAARKIADDAKQPVTERVAAATLLTRDAAQRPTVTALLTGWLTPQTPAEGRRAAVTLLARLGGDQVPGLLLQNWDAHTPETRQAIIEELLRRANWTQVLLDRISKGEVAPQQLDATTQARLLNHKLPKIQAAAEKLLKTSGTAERQAVVDAYRAALTLKGDARHGATVFAGICANCHKLGDTGRDIGPDLRSVAANDAEKLLVAMLDPNAAVLPGFNAYNCELADGEELYGLIGAETATSISLKLLDGTTRQVLRTQVKALRSSRLSLMPEGLEANLKPQDFADVIAYIRQAGAQ